MTEEFPPYNYQLEAEQSSGTEEEKKTLISPLIKGLSFDIVSEMSKRVQEHEVEFRLYPWLRAYRLAVDTPNTAIFSIGKNSKREDLFHWVGVIAPAKFYLFSKPSRKKISPTNLEEAKKYTVGTFPKSVREQYLLENGFEQNRNLISIYNYERLFDMLQLNRIDLWAMNELLAYHIVKKKGLDPDTSLNKALFLSELSPEGYYLAFNKKTDVSIVEKYQLALNSMKKDGTYQKILAHYSVSE